jgi:hypothetical protein
MGYFTAAFFLTVPLAHAQPIDSTSTNHSATVTTGPTIIVLPIITANSPPRTYKRVVNVGTASNGTAWCSRYVAIPAANGTGSFPLAPFGNTLNQPSVEEYGPSGFVPQQPLYCIASGSTGYVTVKTSP